MEWIMSGGLIALVGLMLANNHRQDTKIERNYKRLDEVKEYQDKTFTRSDICNVIHKQINETLVRLETKVDKLLNGQR